MVASIFASQQPAFRGGGAWTPADLGAKVWLWYDAEDAATLTLSGSLVDSWADKRGTGVVPAQTTSGFKPTLNPTGLNNRPAVVFDGSDDYLSVIGVNALVPALDGSASYEIWGLTNDLDTVSSTLRFLLCFGSTNALSRGLLRGNSTPGFGGIVLGDGATATIEYSTTPAQGIHAWRLAMSSGNSNLYRDSNVSILNSTRGLSTTANRLVLGSRTPTASFWQGPLNSVLVTAPLTAGEATQMMNFLKTRGGIP